MTLHNQHQLEDGRMIRLFNDNILVRVDEPPKASGSGLVLFPNGSMIDVNNTGTILAYGFTTTKKGVVMPIPDLQKGLRCVFIRFAAEQDSNKQIRERLAKDLIRIKTSDIMVLFDDGDFDRLRPDHAA